MIIMSYPRLYFAWIGPGAPKLWPRGSPSSISTPSDLIFIRPMKRAHGISEFASEKHIAGQLNRWMNDSPLAGRIYMPWLVTRCCLNSRKSGEYGSRSFQSFSPPSMEELFANLWNYEWPFRSAPFLLKVSSQSSWEKLHCQWRILCQCLEMFDQHAWIHDNF
jgi:hypothetical protein